MEAGDDGLDGGGIGGAEVLEDGEGLVEVVEAGGEVSSFISQKLTHHCKGGGFALDIADLLFELEGLLVEVDRTLDVPLVRFESA